MTRVRVRRKGSTLKEVRSTTFLGVGRNVATSFFNNSIHNLSNAVEARVFRRQIGGVWSYIDSTPHKIGQYLKFCGVNDFCDFEIEFDKHVETVTPMTNQEFVRHYSGRRRRVYENALISLKNNALTFKDAFCKCFLKKEKDIPSDKEDAIPRVITHPEARFGLEYGKFIKAIEPGFYHCINSVYKSVTVMKGLNYSQIGQQIFRKFQRFVDPCSMDGDVSRMDSSVSDEGNGLYHVFAQKFFEHDDQVELKKLCDMQLNVPVKGRANDGNLKFISRGLSSGQMNTSQTGVFIVCFIIYALIQHLSIDIELVNCGDDFTVIGERKDIILFESVCKAWFADFNMILKTEPMQDQIEKIVFCQTQPVLVDGVYRMVRDPFTALVKDSSSIDDLNRPALQGAFLNAISQSGIATHGGIPIFQEVYKMFARSAQTYVSKNKRTRGTYKKFVLSNHSMVYWGKGLNYKYRVVIPDETRYSFYLAFGIDPVMQRYIESYYSTFLIMRFETNMQYGDTFDWNDIRL